MRPLRVSEPIAFTTLFRVKFPQRSRDSATPPLWLRGKHHTEMRVGSSAAYNLGNLFPSEDDVAYDFRKRHCYK